MKKWFLNQLRSFSFLLLPLISYLSFKIVNSLECNYFFGLFFYFQLLITVFYFIVFQVEKIYEYNNNKNLRFFLFQISSIILILSFVFTLYYWCLFDYDPSNFSNLKTENRFLVIIDFFFYGLGVFLMNNNSTIQADSFLAKLFVGTEMFSAFIILVLIFANYADFKNSKKKIGEKY